MDIEGKKVNGKKPGDLPTATIVVENTENYPLALSFDKEHGRLFISGIAVKAGTGWRIWMDDYEHGTPPSS